MWYRRGLTVSLVVLCASWLQGCATQDQKDYANGLMSLEAERNIAKVCSYQITSQKIDGYNHPIFDCTKGE